MFSVSDKYKMSQILGKEYKVFNGNSYKNLMSQLIKSSLVPMNIADIMRARLESVKCDQPEQKEFWLDNHFNTADGVAYYNDKVKIVRDAHALKEIQLDMKLSSGTLILTPEKYKILEGEEFSRDYLKKIGINNWLNKSEIKSHPVWRALARDNHLLSEYVDLIFAEVKQRYNGNNTIAMGIYLGCKQEKPTMKAWFVDRLFWRSDAGGGVCFPYNGYIRLVGVRAKSSSQKENLDEKIS